MAKKAQTQAAAPVAPDPAQYQAYPQQYYVDPNKGKAKLLTFEYLFAMGSAVVAASLLINSIVAVFGLWVGSSQSLVSEALSGQLLLSMVTPNTSIVATAVFAVLLSVISFILFARVSKAIPDREGYTDRTAYKLITYGGFGVLLVSAVAVAAKLVSILLNSLLFIGVDGAGEIYKSLYLKEFAPYLLSLAVLAGAIYCVYQIIQGRNLSRVLTLVLLASSSVVLLACAITMAVKVHDSDYSDSGSSSSTSRTLQEMLKDY